MEALLLEGIAEFGKNICQAKPRTGRNWLMALYVGYSIVPAVHVMSKKRSDDERVG